MGFHTDAQIFKLATEKDQFFLSVFFVFCPPLHELCSYGRSPPTLLYSLTDTIRIISPTLYQYFSQLWSAYARTACSALGQLHRLQLIYHEEFELWLWQNPLALLPLAM